MDLAGRGYPVRPLGPLDPGDVAFHAAWTLHRAGAQPAGTPPRAALSAQYYLDGTRLLPKGRGALRAGADDDEDRESFADWLPGMASGAVANHALTPLADMGEEG